MKNKLEWVELYGDNVTRFGRVDKSRQYSMTAASMYRVVRVINRLDMNLWYVYAETFFNTLRICWYFKNIE